MTEERLDQILKQALSPEIDDSEIRIRRKAAKMNTKKVLSIGLAVCAAILVVVAGGYLWGRPLQKITSSNVTDLSVVPKNNIFAVTANAAELPENTTSGEFVGLCPSQTSQGDLLHLSFRFYISGENIERVKVTTNKCNIYYAVPSTEEEVASNQGNNTMNDGYYFLSNYGDDYYEHQVIPGQSFEGAYNEEMSFGMSVPQELWSDNDDPRECFYETTNQIDGAILAIEVTFDDGSVETHHYKVTVGKVYVPLDENGCYVYDSITRFVESEEESGTIGYLFSQID